MSIAASPPPLAWYGSSFAYYDDEPEPTAEERLDADASSARAERRSGFDPEQFGPRPGGGAATGVVLGRFLPVHDGHRYLIEFALAHTADVHVFVRVGPEDPVPWQVRRDWLHELFPTVKLSAVDDGADTDAAAVQAHWTAHVLAEARPDYLFTAEPYGPGLAYRLGARLMWVDRRAIPVSGTEVRADPWAWRQHLPPPVRAWYTRRVCLIGAESTGKTTLAARLAEAYDTVWVPEQLRNTSGMLRPADMSLAAHGQLSAEGLLARRANRLLFCDTDVLSVRLWSERLFGAAPGWVTAAAEQSTVELYLLLAPDVPFSGRNGLNAPAERREFHAACERELLRLGRHHVTLDGDYDQRYAKACEAVDALPLR